MGEIFGLLMALWISGFGFSMILKQHPAYWNWTMRVVRTSLRFLWQQLAQLARWSWRHYRQFIVGFATGILVALYFTGRLP